MEENKDIFTLTEKAKFVFMSNSANINVSLLAIKFFEKRLMIESLLNEFDFDSMEQSEQVANSTMLLINQCEIIYRSMLICASNNFEATISKTVERMEITKEYKDYVRDFLLLLLSNNRYEDLAHLLVLLNNVEIRKQSSPIIKDYVPNITTIATADTTFYANKGLINGELKNIFKPDYILINVWSSMPPEAQREALYHELTHIIVYPDIMEEDEINYLQMEEKVENYLKSLGLKQEHINNLSNILSNQMDNLETNNSDHENFKIEETNAKIRKILNDLKSNGFQILKQDDELIAFCEERNILFFSNDMNYLLNHYENSNVGYYQQPYITYDGGTHISFYTNLKQCRKEKIDFPLFTESNYLWLYNHKDNDDPFNSSLKRIASIPELYNAVGYDNQQLINQLVSKSTIVM